MVVIIIILVGEDKFDVVIVIIIIFYVFSLMFIGIVFYFMGKFEFGYIVGFIFCYILIGCIGGVGWFLVVIGFEVIVWMDGSLNYDFEIVKKFV